ncbi:hypothetical protein COX75_01855 [bacterium (Candidatus Gribaldobacteria) CG_4_10_14_0_2_um_filter_33_15]|nr:MAG: hypothetical protein COX75_01855 [bacterium (Candidatus Gribaldobacteria) CG_4_10_14_0_2_um_filter_33_15]
MKGDQPVIFIQAKTLPEAFQKTLGKVWQEGCEISTSFDNPNDPPSKDATVLVEIQNPFAEPRFHKLAWPGGPSDLEIYRLEVLFGVHNHWIERGGKGWNYTYHERLRAYDTGDGKKSDQIKEMVKQMIEVPDFYRRRFQVTTWIPSIDPFLNDPPCLQRLHFRWLPGDNDEWVLNLNSDWRSRDLLKAWFMNVIAITDFQRLVAIEVGQKRGIKTRIGRYTDKSDTLHIYGKDFSGSGGVKEILERMEKTPLEDLCWSTEFLKPMFEEARHILSAQLESERQGAGKGVILPDLDVKNFPYPKEWNW